MYRKIIYLSTVVLLLLATGDVFGAKQELSQLEKLGKFIFMDKDLSKNFNQSCMTCHHPAAKFADPDNRKDSVYSPVSVGSDPTLFGTLNAPPACYAGFSPKLHWNYEEGLFIGGLFWDGRASGLPWTATKDFGGGPTGDPLADQAKGPFQNPVEMALLNDEAVIATIRSSEYAALFDKLCAERYKVEYCEVKDAYNFAAIAIAAFERSFEVNKFSSRFDKFVKEQGGDVSAFGIEVVDDETGNEFRSYVGPPPNFKSKYFSYEEADGLALFNADSDNQGPEYRVGGMCYACHLTTKHVVKKGDDPNNVGGLVTPGTYPPLFTDFSYDNLGIPANSRIRELVPDVSVAYGLGGALAEGGALAGLCEFLGNDCVPGDEKGKHKVSTLRNIAKTAPYGHNGYFATLEEIVHFYNTRKVEEWPEPEVPKNVNGDELGNLGLSPDQEAKIVKFMRTLTDE